MEKPTKLTNPTNHNWSKLCEKPIRIPVNYRQLAQSEGKIPRTRRKWCNSWVYFSMVGKLALDFWVNHSLLRSNRYRVVPVDNHLKTALWLGVSNMFDMVCRDRFQLHKLEIIWCFSWFKISCTRQHFVEYVNLILFLFGWNIITSQH